MHYDTPSFVCRLLPLFANWSLRFLYMLFLLSVFFVFLEIKTSLSAKKRPFFGLMFLFLLFLHRFKVAVPICLAQAALSGRRVRAGLSNGSNN